MTELQMTKNQVMKDQSVTHVQIEHHYMLQVEVEVDLSVIPIQPVCLQSCLVADKDVTLKEKEKELIKEWYIQTLPYSLQGPYNLLVYSLPTQRLISSCKVNQPQSISST